MKIFLNGPVTNWGCGVVNSSWSALHTGHPSYWTCHFFFLFNSFFSASTVLFSPVLFQIARILIFGRLKKNNFFFRVESWRSRPIRSTEDVTRWNRSNHFLNFFLKKSNFFRNYYFIVYLFYFLIIKMNLAFCIILSLRPRELEMCHRNKPRIKYSRSTKMFSPNFQNWSFSKNYFYVIKI